MATPLTPGVVLHPYLQVNAANSNHTNTNQVEGVITNVIDHSTGNAKIIVNKLETKTSGSTLDIKNATVDFEGSTILHFPSVATTGDVNQSSGASAQLANTSFATGSTFNGTGATFSNLLLTGANGNRVDNATLPANLSTTTVTGTTSITTPILYNGTAGTGSITQNFGSNFVTTANSNAAATVATISGLVASTSKYVLEIFLSGISATNVVDVSFKILKTNTASGFVVTQGSSFTSDSTKLTVPTVTVSSGSVVINQVATTTSDGVVAWNVKCRYNAVDATATVITIA